MFFRRYSEGINVLRLGYDFYADIAERIVENRKKVGLTQEQLAKKAGIPPKRLCGYEQVKVRIRLDDLDKLSKVLDVTTDYLIGAEYDDPDCGDCLYEVWNERFEVESDKFHLMFSGSSPQMAFLKAHKWSIDAGTIWFEARARARIKLIGVPVRKADYSMLRNREAEYNDEVLPN